MLLWLHIKNVALIEKAEIEFTDGLNVLSGETGAGKSMIIDSINFVLGERTSKNFIRSGEEKAQVQAGFQVTDTQIRRELSDLDIDIEDDTIIISRVMTAEGKSTARINGVIVTAGMIKQLSENLIDIHGQHEHQSLLNASKHMGILDKYCADELEPLRLNLAGCIKEYKTILAGLKDLSGDDEEREERIEKLRYRIDEIDEADLKEGEEEALTERKTYLNNIDKIIKLARQCGMLLYLGDDENNAARDSLGEVQRLLGQLTGLDEKSSELFDDISALNVQLEDICRKVKRYNDALEDGGDEIDAVEERLDRIYKLKKKYGGSITEVLAYRQEAERELDFILNSEAERAKLNAQKEQIYEKIRGLCSQMTRIRTEKAQLISAEIENQLKDLEMKNASFQIQVTEKETFNANGCNWVEFLISPNMGETLKPLAKIASGGEMSRVMLALKTVVAKLDTIDTLIFDEIDTGISGNTASRVGEKMSIISGGKQLLCITHLPQIASMADAHFLIEKFVRDNKTKTVVHLLDESARIEEISRLMGGDLNSRSVAQAAKEMILNSQKYKQKYRQR